MIAKAMNVDAIARRRSDTNGWRAQRRDDGGDQRDVDRVEGGRGESDLEGEPAEALIRERGADPARGGCAERVDRRVEENAHGRLAPDHLDEELRDDAHDDRRRPSVDRGRPDDEHRGERRASDRHVLDRDGEGFDERGGDEERHHPGERRGGPLASCQRRESEDRDERAAEDDRGDDGEEPGRFSGHANLPRVLGVGLGDRLRAGQLAPLVLPTPGSSRSG